MLTKQRSRWLTWQRHSGHLLLAAGVVVTLVAVWAPLARAARPLLTLSVTDCSQFGHTGDAGGTLHDALDTAFSNSGSSISFAYSGSITVPKTSAPIQVNNTLSISGAGQAVILDGGGSAENIFHMFLISASGNLTLDHLTLTDCYNDGSDSSSLGGAAVRNNQGTLMVSNVTFSNNQDVNGGGAALFNTVGVVTITNSTFSNNYASGMSSSGGGGVFTDVGNVSVTGTTFSNNTTDTIGGGVVVYSNLSATLSVGTSTFIGNHAGNSGGGLANSGGDPTNVWDDTFSGNSAGSGGGGGLSDNGGNLIVTNTTVTGNSATTGGGVQDGCCYLGLTNVTVTGNSATTGGGLAVNQYEAGTVANSIVAGNPTGGDCSGVGPGTYFGDSGYNLTDASDASCSFTPSKHDVLTSTPGLAGGLANNGGPTQTIALLPGSPAINVVSPATCAWATGNLDQRGFPRGGSWGCDIGAFELQLPSAHLFLAGPGLVAGKAPVLFTGSNSADGVAPAVGYYCFVLGAGPCPSDAYILVAQLPVHLTLTGTMVGVYTLQAYIVDSAGDRGEVQTRQLVLSSGPPPLKSPRGTIPGRRR